MYIQPSIPPWLAFKPDLMADSKALKALKPGWLDLRSGLLALDQAGWALLADTEAWRVGPEAWLAGP